MARSGESNNMTTSYNKQTRCVTVTATLTYHGYSRGQVYSSRQDLKYNKQWMNLEYRHHSMKVSVSFPCFSANQRTNNRTYNQWALPNTVKLGRTFLVQRYTSPQHDKDKLNIICLQNKSCRNACL